MNGEHTLEDVGDEQRGGVLRADQLPGAQVVFDLLRVQVPARPTPTHGMTWHGHDS